MRGLARTEVKGIIQLGARKLLEVVRTGAMEGGGGGGTNCKRINIKGSGANKCDRLVHLRRRARDGPEPH